MTLKFQNLTDKAVAAKFQLTVPSYVHIAPSLAVVSPNSTLNVRLQIGALPADFNQKIAVRTLILQLEPEYDPDDIRRRLESKPSRESLKKSLYLNANYEKRETAIYYERSSDSFAAQDGVMSPEPAFDDQPSEAPSEYAARVAGQNSPSIEPI